MYVLIVASWFGAHAFGYAIITQEFSSRETCMQAASIVQGQTKDATWKLKVECTPK